MHLLRIRTAEKFLLKKDNLQKIYLFKPNGNKKSFDKNLYKFFLSLYLAKDNLHLKSFTYSFLLAIVIKKTIIKNHSTYQL